MTDPQADTLLSVGALAELVGVTVRTLRPPLVMSQTPLSIRRGAPPLGAHTAEVLAEKLGYDAKRVNQLIAGGAVGAAPAPPKEEAV